MKKYENYVSHLKILEKAPEQDDEEVWLSMLKERNNTARIYDGEAAKRLVNKILVDYIPAFVEMQRNIEIRYGANL